MDNKGGTIRLGHKKRAAKAALTRFETYINETDLDAVGVDELKARIVRFDEAYDTFNEMQIELAASDDTISTQELDIKSENIENKYIRLKVTAERVIKEKSSFSSNNEEADQTVVEARGIISNNERVHIPAYNAHVRLPRIELPTFTGAYEDWQAFYDMFNSIIHSNRDLSDTQKFHYLRSSLKGEAAEVVSSLEISGNNYAGAWARLRERYDNKRLIIQNHIKAIFDLPIVRRESCTAIRQVLDGVLKHTRALQTLNRPTEQWDDLLVHIIASKLDIRTIKWENTIDPVNIPSFSDLLEFLKRRCQTLEAVAKTVNNSVAGTISRQGSHHKTNNCNVATVNIKCLYCKCEHSIYLCKEFKNLPVSERINQAKYKGLCLNCLRGKHLAKDCHSGPCKICSKRHNSLLHNDNYKDKSEVKPKPKEENNSDKDSNSVTCSHSSSTGMIRSSQVLLSTAVIKIKHKDGHFVEVKALLDNGSQSNFVSTSLVKRLKLEPRDSLIEIKGINQQISKASRIVQLKVNSRFESYATDLQCVILPTITQRVPNVRIERQQLDIPKNIRLVDPRFHIPSEVELLIGAEKFWDLLCVGQVKLGRGKPTLQKTLLGWIVAGRLDITIRNILQASCYFSCTQELDETLQKFWQIENVTDDKKILAEDSYCEEHFKKTHSRNSQGRFVIELPIKEDVINNMGNSEDIAMKRFLSLEKRLSKEPSLKSKYIEFMREYEKLGHMRMVDSSQNTIMRVFLPHQAVVKESSATTKVRVVFDASSKDNKGISLNEALHKGPVIQSDLFSIILRFRCFKYVLSADITKMYRQILVHKDHTSLQTIMWRENVREPVRLYELVTLTYGTRPASFIATKCLQQLAEVDGKNCPLAAKAIREDFYMDDLLTGADTVEELLQLKEQIAEILREGGFELHKWNSNIAILRKDNCQGCEEFVELEKEQESKLLGITWNPRKDTLHFVTPVRGKNGRVTKRAILSEISRLFDPLGLVGPVITLAKILMQSLWACRIGWDDAVQVSVHNSWSMIRSQLSTLESISIPRLVIGNNETGRIFLHGFSDASEQAYGACIYIVYNPEVLKNSSLCWEGPSWLRTMDNFPTYNNKDIVIDSVSERRNEALTVLAQICESVINFDRFSSLGKILRTTAYVLRFKYNVKCAKDMCRLGYISILELKEAQDVLINLIQSETWETEIRRLRNNQEVSKESNLIGLKPFLDEGGLIRVGGRLDHSSLSHGAKHPLVLPAVHHFTRLVILDRHRRLFHTGVNATLASVREEFWPIHAKNEVKKCLRACVTCRKANPIPNQPLMGQLPEVRVNIARPSSKVGVDYCGPIFVRDRVRRNSKQYKAYVAIFVCMATKAVHIELVEDMTTEAFIGALKRFIARRGLPADIYSDNGRNFVGAERELQQLFDDSEFEKRICETTVKEGIAWHFIPARAPHFGGLWEAAVKSMKRRLKRTIGTASLSVTEMITVLSQIEAILNSRPITPMSDDPKDLEVLTPGHFLIGNSMTALPQSDVQEILINRLSRWQHVDQINQRFWFRWSREYLTTCQQRTKWKVDSKSTIRVGQLVMMKEDEVMPWKWTIARVLEEHRGKDGIVRAATVRTARGNFKRPIIKMAPILEV